MIRFSVLIDHDLCGLVSKDHLLLAAKSILKIEGEIFLDDDQKWGQVSGRGVTTN